MDVTFGFLALLFCGMIYFLPTIVALNKSAPQVDAICILNLFLGWTLLGWVVALVWAVAEPKRN